MKPEIIQPCQLRAARALVEMSQRELAERSGVGITTIKRFELANSQLARPRTLEVLTKTLEVAGVIFLAEGRGNGPGVRLIRATRSGRLE